VVFVPFVAGVLRLNAFAAEKSFPPESQRR